MKRSWPPAAATSSARLALSWPLMSRRSGCDPADARKAGSRRDSTCVPLKVIDELGQRAEREEAERIARGEPPPLTFVPWPARKQFRRRR
jgi:hypothetical protein